MRFTIAALLALVSVAAAQTFDTTAPHTAIQIGTPPSRYTPTSAASGANTVMATATGAASGGASGSGSSSGSGSGSDSGSGNSAATGTMAMGTMASMTTGASAMETTGAASRVGAPAVGMGAALFAAMML